MQVEAFDRSTHGLYLSKIKHLVFGNISSGHKIDWKVVNIIDQEPGEA